jgi:CRP/FNR family cyclic AMP-dependent transcriptional regulator
LWWCEVPIREALGLFPGNYIPSPVLLPNGFPAKKPCRSIETGPFLPIQKFVAGAPKPAAPKPDPLFLFYCGMDWHRRAESGAGWELVQAMRSQDKGIRALAAELLAGTENGRLLVRDLRRRRSGLNQLARHTEDSHLNAGPEKGEDMHTPYGLEMVENYTTCTLRKQNFFCQFSGDLLRAFESFSHLTSYPGGAVLFVEGQMPRGAFVLCSGKVKITTTSKEGKVIILRIAEPGDVIGLSAMISGQTYEIAAETLGPCLVNFVEREGLLRLIERSGELGLRSALAVSREFQDAYREIHELVLTRSSSGKLARLLLSWVGGDGKPGKCAFRHRPLTRKWRRELAHHAKPLRAC